MRTWLISSCWDLELIEGRARLQLVMEEKFSLLTWFVVAWKGTAGGVFSWDFRTRDRALVGVFDPCRFLGRRNAANGTHRHSMCEPYGDCPFYFEVYALKVFYPKLTILEAWVLCCLAFFIWYSSAPIDNSSSRRKSDHDSCVQYKGAFLLRLANSKGPPPTFLLLGLSYGQSLTPYLVNMQLCLQS